MAAEEAAGAGPAADAASRAASGAATKADGAAGAATTVDAAAPRPSAPRQPVDVAVGVLIDGRGPDARFLLTSRPAGKAYAGYWEFPGGKVEAGETIEAALARELHEELGITLAAGREGCERWQVEVFDYPHALVRLHFCKVFAWSGEFVMREGQQMAWQTLPVQVVPVLPGTLPVLAWFAKERGFAGATHRESGQGD